MLHIKVNDSGKKGGSQHLIFFRALAKTNWCNKRWITLFLFLKIGKKKRETVKIDVPSLSRKLTHGMSSKLENDR